MLRLVAPSGPDSCWLMRPPARRPYGALGLADGELDRILVRGAGASGERVPGLKVNRGADRRRQSPSAATADAPAVEQHPPHLLPVLEQRRIRLLQLRQPRHVGAAE